MSSYLRAAARQQSYSPKTRPGGSRERREASSRTLFKIYNSAQPGHPEDSLWR
jgi:hypothetical protein